MKIRGEGEMVDVGTDAVGPDGMSAVMALIERDGEDARCRFVACVPCLDASEVVAMAGSAQRVASWVTMGLVTSFVHDGTERFPAFQFADDAPRPEVAVAVRVLRERLSPWATTAFFVSPSAWLDGRAPAAALDDPRLREAARRYVDFGNGGIG